jgi:cbb3-type cytochrome oxidase maturation protein
MNSLVFLIPIAVALAAVFLFLFLRAVKDGQFDDLDDPPRRILKDD